MAARLKILMISPQFRPLVGGYERSAERLSAELVRQGHEVTVIAERRDRQWPRVEQLDGVIISRLWCVYRRRLHMLTSLMSFAIYLIRYGSQYDIFHVHQYGSHAAIAVVLGNILHRPVALKLTSTAQEGIASIHSNGGWNVQLVASLLRRVSLCIAPTRPAAEEAVRFGIPSLRIAVIPNGIDTSFYRPCGIEEKSRLRDMHGVSDGPVVLYVGRLSAAKNPEGLIDAWALLHVRMPEAQLIVVGDGPLRGIVESRIVQYQLSHVVTLVGEEQNVGQWYGVTDLFVLPSHYEGLSNSLIEAMSCGLPVVSTRVSGSADILAECDVGDLVDVGDMHGLSEAILQLLRDPIRLLECGARSREYAEQRLAVNKVAAETVKGYRRALHADDVSGEYIR